LTTGEHEVDDAIAALWLRQRAEMMRRVDVVDAALTSLRSDSLAEDERDEAERTAHKIAGSAGTFGFATASRCAREIELALRAGVSSEEAERLIDLLAEIRRDFARSEPSAGVSDAAPAVAINADVLLINGPRVDDVRLKAELGQHGLSVLVAQADDDVALRANASIVIVDLAEQVARDYLERLGQRDEIIIGLAAGTGLEARVDFVRRGGRMLLPADMPPHEIAEAANSLRERLDDEGTRILVVDDDEALLEVTTTILRAHGLEVVALDDPSRFWHVLESRDPDVLLLDLEMPDFNGLELCQAVRADPRWAQLPILFLTARTEPESVRAVYAAGADDYMSKPVVEEELVQRIQNRLERIRLLRDLADRDAMTGVANRRKASEQLARLERLARRYGQPLTLAMIDVDHFKRVNDSFGHDTGDEVLRRLGRRLAAEFRGEDVVGRWGGEEFVVGMYGMPGVLAVERMRGLLEEWKRERFEDPRGGEFSTSFTVGLAELPGTAESLDDLILGADDALYRGKAAGRSRVEIAGVHSTTPSEQVDIALVDDDEILADTLLETLTTEGWSVRVLSDGRTAVGSLAASPPILDARLVLLDWDLPHLDGLTVLRRMRDRGALARTKVVMLTAHAEESDVLSALALGASDHVAKPFSVAVLCEKIRQLLDER
jgi:diguanylate cyclase (GGDEF)-like protein